MNWIWDAANWWLNIHFLYLESNTEINWIFKQISISHISFNGIRTLVDSCDINQTM